LNLKKGESRKITEEEMEKLV
jgi:hypothetical protein